MNRKQTIKSKDDASSLATVAGGCIGFICGILASIELYHFLGVATFASAYPLVTLGMAFLGASSAWWLSKG